MPLLNCNEDEDKAKNIDSSVNSEVGDDSSGIIELLGTVVGAKSGGKYLPIFRLLSNALTLFTLQTFVFRLSSYSYDQY